MTTGIVAGWAAVLAEVLGRQAAEKPSHKGKSDDMFCIACADPWQKALKPHWWPMHIPEPIRDDNSQSDQCVTVCLSN